MKLALSSAAAPGLGFDALIDACLRRGLEGVELVEGHAHGATPAAGAHRLAELRDRAAASGIEIVAYRLASAGSVDVAAVHRMAEMLGAPVFPAVCGLSCAVDDVEKVALCWQVEPAVGDVTPQIKPTLRAAGRMLACIRMCGAGPESAQWSGRGIGSLMVALTMSGFAGSLILAPSSVGTLPVWRTWLGRAKGWGCGSRNGDRDLVQLSSIV